MRVRTYTRYLHTELSKEDAKQRVDSLPKHRSHMFLSGMNGSRLFQREGHRREGREGLFRKGAKIRTRLKGHRQMKWPFKRNKSVPLTPLPVIQLTEEERLECEAMLRSFTQAPDGQHAVLKEGLADSFQRSIIALCLMGRAKRFLILSKSQPAAAEDACHTAAKVCAAYPLSIYFYDFGCILEQVGKTADATAMFREFLRRHDSERPGPIGEITLRQRDVIGAVRDARQQLSIK
jgi:hypothetical protein